MLVNCKRCNGNGVIESYRMLNGGTCFNCGGSGKEEVSERTAKKREKQSTIVDEIAREKAKIQDLFCNNWVQDWEPCGFKMQGHSKETAQHQKCPKCKKSEWVNDREF